jgi:predicted membrane-bound mannosyltransferase
MLINFLDIPGFWNLVWIVPLGLVTGFGLAAIFGGGKSRNPEGPPYANFEETP